MLSKWQYSQIISTVSAGSTATIVLAATTSFCRLRPTYSVLQIRRSVRQSRMLLLLLLPEPNLLAALEIAQPSFPLLWPSPSETTVVLMKLYASQRVLAELNTLTVSAEQSNLNENKSRANHPSHYIHYFKTA